jgi:hypothetical protein
MTSNQVAVLGRATRNHGALKGTALMFEQQFGKMRQVRWLVARRLCYIRGGRLIANKDGIKIYNYQTGH